MADCLGSRQQASLAVEPVILANATCDGCGNASTYVQVVNRAPSANVCLCRGCLEIEPPSLSAAMSDGGHWTQNLTKGVAGHSLQAVAGSVATERTK